MAAPRTTAGAVLICLALTAVLSCALPVPQFELEAGSRPVGTVAFDLVDEATGRVTPVQVWFPTSDDATGERLRVTEDAEGFGGAVSSFLGLPPFILGHLGQVRTTALVGAEPVTPAGGLPLVLALHGWGGFRMAQAPLLEQLAADGHVVMSIDHTGGALASQPVNGPLIPIDLDLLPSDVPADVYDAAAARLERLFADDALRLLAALGSADAAVPAEVLTAVDLDRMVLLGHSTGGGAAAIVCAETHACDAFVGFDPWVEPVPADVRRAGFAAPTLVLLSEEWTGNGNDAVLRPMLAATTDAHLRSVTGTKHRDVTVEALLSPLGRRLGISGTLGAERTHGLALAYTRAMLAATLGTGPGDPALLDDADVPDVVVLPDANVVVLP